MYFKTSRQLTYKACISKRSTSYREEYIIEIMYPLHYAEMRVLVTHHVRLFGVH